jgi:hypothetical protein
VPGRQWPDVRACQPNQGLGNSTFRKESSPRVFSVRVLRHQEKVRGCLHETRQRYRGDARADRPTRKSVSRLHRRVGLEIRRPTDDAIRRPEFKQERIDRKDIRIIVYTTDESKQSFFL